jgi:hypothetical protein
MDAGTPVAAFTVKRELQSYLRRKLGMFLQSTRLHVRRRQRPVNRDHVEGAGALTSFPFLPLPNRAHILLR